MTVSQQHSRVTEAGLETRRSYLGVRHYQPKKFRHSQRFQLVAEQQSCFEKTSSLWGLKNKNDDLPLTLPSLSGRASQDAATEVGLPFNGQTSRFSGALAGAVKQPYPEKASKKD